MHDTDMTIHCGQDEHRQRELEALQRKHPDAVHLMGGNISSAGSTTFGDWLLDRQVSTDSGMLSTLRVMTYPGDIY